MATRGLSIGEDPTQVTGLSNGTTYIGQNVSNWPIHVAAVAGSDAPDVTTTPSLRAKPGESITLLPVSGESIWLWSPYGAAQLVYDAVP